MDREGSDSGQLLPARKGRASVVHLPDHWFVVARSSELREAPVGARMFGTPLVLFRDEAGRPGALVDCCPHRNVPLSLGKTVDGTVQCPYHGWRFTVDGACAKIPGRVKPPDAIAQRAWALPVIEQQGFVWTCSNASQSECPAGSANAPHRFDLLEADGYSSVSFSMDVDSSLHAAIENALDVPHTAFLHGGLFRSEGRQNEIRVQITRTANQAQAEYIGEPRPTGLLARILTPSGGTMTHFDRFILPSVAQIEYRLGDENHVMIESAMTPLDDFKTRIHTLITFRLRIPHWFAKPVLKKIARKILEQDVYILEKQTRTIREFGGEQFASTEIDVLGRHILRLLRAAERGESCAGEDSDEIVLVT